MNDHDYKKKLILKIATSCFYERGIRVVSMDDIAKKCAVSKKTIYFFYSSKTELIKEMLKSEAEVFNQQIEILKKNASNSIVEFFFFFEFLTNVRSRMTLEFLYDLKKKDAISGVNTYIESIKSFLQENFIRGVNEGLYNPIIDIGKQIISVGKICNLLFLIQIQ